MLNVSMGLCLYREKNNKSEDDLANYLGIQKKAYKRYESGEREPGIDKLYKLAKYYNCAIDDFINVDEKFTVKREEVLSTKDLDNLGCHHQFSHGLVSMLTKGKSHEEMIRFIKDDKTKYVLKSEVKQYLLNLADRIDKN
ncbi:MULTISPECIES: helix-turn-helix transcriptional regulator [Streptococcus]|uniref:helix-turn-helix transcriptional regulator n=1 Tax=Streptococcus TaxID=1301 RepID=UPI0005E65895|nr:MULTISPECIES: helix-turn-helix transcriptional regulator [Streptococcus]MBF9648046.1 helix-turn-helix transcriptional regulator [Streptococcus pseudopneumoniae]MBW8104861.1 helix-turn-helix transcriptional regulator [Streptococcus pseudopneumoniae]NIB94354.1 XRE family transcriptional regulator [Streptococcus pseudopneumoniae]CJQ12729.1 HTH-type transcriptional regulator dicA [Streptococcus pneumoniae]CKG74426.1 HTH-type transcriptional regulator dicA [Streptococcus pneumoniae]